MVDDDVVKIAKSVLGEQPRKILVTGATGFVGRRLAATLNKAGQDVTATGRNRYLAPPQIQFIRADIRNATEVIELCRGQDVVIHCASNTSPWGPYEKLAEANVQGTKNVVEGCFQHNVSRLVHVSSTSLQFGFQDAFNVSEHDPPPKTFACNYAKTKHAAEEVIRRACERGLNALTVRARAVYGPGDQSLLPRVLLAYDKGRLRQIGNGTNVTDLTYIDNLVHALILAIDRGETGATCTITGGKPLNLWELLRHVLEETGRKDPLKKVPYGVAFAFTQLSELVHRVMRLRGEPTITCYGVGLLAKSQTFNTESASRELNYQPVVSQSEGIQRTLDSMIMKRDDPSPTKVDVRLFTTGYTTQSHRVVESGAEPKKVRIHAMFALIAHPVHGITLFDTGYSPRFYDATKRWPYRAYAKLTPVETSAESTCLNVLKAAGVEPQEVKRIVLSHLHADHVCGLRDFPDADIIATAAAWNSVSGTTGITALRHGFLPDLFPENIADRLHLLPSFVDPGIGPFDHCHDLFSDGSIRLVDLPGHANGQMGALLQTEVDKKTFLVADATWTQKTITENLPPTLAFRTFADSSRDVKATLKKLHEFHNHYPDVQLIPTHCPAVAEQFEFDKQLEKLPGAGF